MYVRGFCLRKSHENIEKRYVRKTAIIIIYYNASRMTSVLKMLMQARVSVFPIFHMTIVISDLYDEKNIVKVSNELQKLFIEGKKKTN